MGMDTPDLKEGKWCQLFNHEGEALLTFNWENMSQIYSQLFVHHPNWSRAELFDGDKHIGNFDFTEIK